LLLLSLLLLAAWESGSGQVHYSVPEEAKHGTFVGRIAQDLGLELAELVPRLFRVASKGRGDLLEVNLKNGILFVNSRIDREELCGRSAECSIHLEVIVDRPLQVFHVEVEVTDINDNPPVFPESEKRIIIAESRPPETRFPLDGASDADIGVNSALTYRVDPNDYFTLDTQNSREQMSSLSLVLRKSLDREEIQEHSLLLTASDGGKPELTSTVQLLITILDVNDNAPEFDQLIYKVRILENSLNGSLVIKLNATDPDDGTNADITYSFRRPVSPAILYAFYINPDSGEIRTKGKLDFEENKLYEISVEAIDKGNIPMAGHCTILVEIVDINDNAPEVTITSLALPVREDAQVGTVIALVSVSDRDSGANGQVTCSLMAHNPFKLVSTFKNYYSIVLDSVLDRESASNYEVVVTARDGGSPSLRLSRSLELHKVHVHVLDINDNSPHFPAGDVQFHIPEFLMPGARFTLPNAEDADEGSNGLLSYSLSPSRHFRLDMGSRVDGSEFPELVLEKALDREQRATHRLVLTARDGGLPARSGEVQVTIVVVDANDNAPVFERSVYRTEVPETAPNGTVLFRVQASDPDEGSNGEIRYSLSNSTQAKLRHHFHVHPRNGEVRVAASLGSPETLLEAYIEARDEGAFSLASTAKLLVEVTDVNDHAPEVNLLTLSSPVSEDAATGTVIALLNVRDEDLGPNGKVTCSMYSGGPFKLKASFGNYYSLVTDGPLDREQVGEYQVLITASDGGSPPLSTRRTLTVSVADVNDNTPSFPKSKQELFVAENNAPGASLGHVFAQDPDLGKNGLVFYELLDIISEGQSASSLVEVDSSSGAITAKISFDFEWLRGFHFQVEARDGGFPPRSATVTVNLFVVDRNDNAPVILFPLPKNGSVPVEIVPRSARTGHLITKVVAEDADSGSNAWLSYYIFKASDSSLFRISANMGELRTARLVLPTDAVKQKVVVVVQDHGDPSLSASVTLGVLLSSSAPQVLPDFEDGWETGGHLSAQNLYLTIALACISFLFLGCLL
ncbi:Protocadherin alpha-C1, partial [Bos mutus]